jgi:hypothetical protein
VVSGEVVLKWVLRGVMELEENSSFFACWAAWYSGRANLADCYYLTVLNFRSNIH